MVCWRTKLFIVALGSCQPSIFHLQIYHFIMWLAFIVQLSKVTHNQHQVDMRTFILRVCKILNRCRKQLIISYPEMQNGLQVAHLCELKDIRQICYFFVLVESIEADLLQMSKVIQPISPTSNQDYSITAISKYNVSFLYRKPQPFSKRQGRNLDPIHLEQSLSLRKSMSKQIQNTFTRTSMHSFAAARSSSCQQTQKCFQNCMSKLEQNQQDNFLLSRYGFPQRKKKSGDQQLLKLLLKNTDRLIQNQKYHKELQRRHSPLFDQNVQTHQKIIPRLKYRTRFNCTKGMQNAQRIQLFRSQRHHIINSFRGGSMQA